MEPSCEFLYIGASKYIGQFISICIELIKSFLIGIVGLEIFSSFKSILL